MLSCVALKVTPFSRSTISTPVFIYQQDHKNFFRFLQSKMYLLFICLALEPRTLTRWDVHKYARRAYDMGVRYIGGCCGFEPYHIRAIAEEVGLMNK